MHVAGRDGTPPAGSPPVTPAVEVSYDDGRAWFPAVVACGHVAVAHPPGKGWVSLRVRAEGLEHTTPRAYPFGP